MIHKYPPWMTATTVWSYQPKLGPSYRLVRTKRGYGTWFLVNGKPFMELRSSLESLHEAAEQYYKAMLMLMSSHPKWEFYLKEAAQDFKRYFHIKDKNINLIEVQYSLYSTRVENVYFFPQVFVESSIGRLSQYVQEGMPFIIGSADKHYPDDVFDGEAKYFKEKYDVDITTATIDDLPSSLKDNAEDFKQIQALFELKPIVLKIKKAIAKYNPETEWNKIEKKKIPYLNKLIKAKEELMKRATEQGSSDKSVTDELIDKKFNYLRLQQAIDEINNRRKVRLLKEMKERFGLTGIPVKGRWEEGKVIKLVKDESSDKRRRVTQHVIVSENSYIFPIPENNSLYNSFRKIEFDETTKELKNTDSKYIDLVQFFGFDTWVYQFSIIAYFGNPNSFPFYAYMIITYAPDKPYYIYYDWKIVSSETAEDNSLGTTIGSKRFSLQDLELKYLDKAELPPTKDSFYLRTLYDEGVKVEPFLRKCATIVRNDLNAKPPLLQEHIVLIFLDQHIPTAVKGIEIKRYKKDTKRPTEPYQKKLLEDRIKRYLDVIDAKFRKKDREERRALKPPRKRTKKTTKDTTKEEEEKKKIELSWNNFYLQLDLNQNNEPILIYIGKIPTTEKLRNALIQLLQRFHFKLINGQWLYHIPSSVTTIKKLAEHVKPMLYYFKNITQYLTPEMAEKVDLTNAEDMTNLQEELKKLNSLRHRGVSFLPYLYKARKKGSNLFDTPIKLLYEAYVSHDPEEAGLYSKSEEELICNNPLVVDMDSDGNPLLIVGCEAELYPAESDDEKDKEFAKDAVRVLRQNGYTKRNGEWVKKIKPYSFTNFCDTISREVARVDGAIV